MKIRHIYYPQTIGDQPITEQLILSVAVRLVSGDLDRETVSEWATSLHSSKDSNGALRIEAISVESQKLEELISDLMLAAEMDGVDYRFSMSEYKEWLHNYLLKD